MFGCQCLVWSRINVPFQPQSQPFCLPAPIPEWPPGSGFAEGIIRLGEVEVLQITKFEFVWGCNLSQDSGCRVNFYKPVGVPNGFSTLGYYSQTSQKPLRGFLLVAREVLKCENPDPSICTTQYLPALLNPINYTLVWCSDDEYKETFDTTGYLWLPEPPKGYRALGFVVTNKPEKPSLEEVKCVRTDLTDNCEVYRLIFNTTSKPLGIPFQVWSTRPSNRGMLGKGVSVGTFFGSSFWTRGQQINISCLKNMDSSLHAMPTLDQIHALIRNYGPTVFFHPEEIYLPSSVAWFFSNGALLYKKGETFGHAIYAEGSNLPAHCANDGEYWIDLPHDSQREHLKHGNLESAKLYVHVKPALGGTFTDIAMWVFCPFNGPGTLKLGMMNVEFAKVGQHVGDWEHFTLRISNFSGELWSIYFSQHSGGKWVDPFDLEFIQGNKAIVYSSKSGHASYPHPGVYIQGSSRFGIGVRNDAARSDYFVDSSSQYEIIAAEYLGDGIVAEPFWLQYMREWGPTIVYDSKIEIYRIINRLPSKLRYSAENIFKMLPTELCGEEGPTGPKEKNNWVGDERW